MSGAPAAPSHRSSLNLISRARTHSAVTIPLRTSRVDAPPDRAPSVDALGTLAVSDPSALVLRPRAFVHARWRVTPALSQTVSGDARPAGFSSTLASLPSLWRSRTPSDASPTPSHAPIGRREACMEPSMTCRSSSRRRLVNARRRSTTTSDPTLSSRTGARGRVSTQGAKPGTFSPPSTAARPSLHLPFLFVPGSLRSSRTVAPTTIFSHRVPIEYARRLLLLLLLLSSCSVPSLAIPFAAPAHDVTWAARRVQHALSLSLRATSDTPSAQCV